MPELPEVETTKTSLEPLLNQTVSKVSIRFPTLRYAIPSDLDTLVGFRLVRFGGRLVGGVVADGDAPEVLVAVTDRERDGGEFDRSAVERACVLLQCLFDRFGSVFPQCGLMVFPGVVIVSR